MQLFFFYRKFQKVIGSVHLVVVEFVNKENCQVTKSILLIKVFSHVDYVNINVGYL